MRKQKSKGKTDEEEIRGDTPLNIAQWRGKRWKIIKKIKKQTHGYIYYVQFSHKKKEKKRKKYIHIYLIFISWHMKRETEKHKRKKYIQNGNTKNTKNKIIQSEEHRRKRTEKN